MRRRDVVRRHSPTGETTRGRSPRWVRISSDRSPFPAPRPRSASAARSRRPRCSICSAFTRCSAARFKPDDDRIGAPPVVLLSDALWTRRYGADRRIVGQTIRVNGVAHTVIGVMPPRFKFPEFAELWVPFTPNVAAASRDQRDYSASSRDSSRTSRSRKPTPRWWRWRRVWKRSIRSVKRRWCLEAAFRQQLHRAIDAGADRRAAPERAWRGHQLVGERLRPMARSRITPQSSTVRTSKLEANST